MIGWLKSLISRATKVTGGHPASDSTAGMFGYAPTGAGVAVNERTALNNSAVFAAVRLIAESVATLPVGCMERKGDGWEENPAHPISVLFNVSPNPEMIPVVFREILQAHVLTWGNGYAEIERANDGTPLALWPITPDRVRPERARSGEIYYEVKNPTGGTENIPARDMFHIPGLGFDGLGGYAPVTMARESIGLAIAAERYGSSLFGQGAVPGGTLTHPGKLSPEGQNNLRESWNRAHQGPYRGHRVAILTEGVSFTPHSIPPEDAQFLETRKFSIIEIARWFNVPPHLLRDLEHATFSNIEHQGIEYITYTLRPWLVRWGQETKRKLMRPEEAARTDIVYATDELERADAESRNRSYATGRQWGWLSADDIRKKERMNPLPNGMGKTYLTPGNMLPAEGGSDE